MQKNGGSVKVLISQTSKVQKVAKTSHDFWGASKNLQFQKCETRGIKSAVPPPMRGRWRAKGPDTDNENPGPQPLPGKNPPRSQIQGAVKAEALQHKENPGPAPLPGKMPSLEVSSPRGAEAGTRSANNYDAILGYLLTRAIHKAAKKMPKVQSCTY